MHKLVFFSKEKKECLKDDKRKLEDKFIPLFLPN